MTTLDTHKGHVDGVTQQHAIEENKHASCISLYS